VTIVLSLGFIIIKITLTNLKPRRALSAKSTNLADWAVRLKMSQVVQLNDDHNSQCFV